MKNIFISLSIVILMLGCSQPSNLEMNLQQSESFLEQNLLNSSVIEIEPGLQYLILESPQGNSSSPNAIRHNYCRFSWNLNGWNCILELY
jgi:hypothetical protein